MEPYDPDLYSEQRTVQLLERMGVPQEQAREIYSRCPSAPDGRVSIDTLQRVLQEDRNTQALNLHLMAAVLRQEDFEALDRSLCLEQDLTREIER